MTRELWACWEKLSDVPPDAIVLSFLPPGEEASLERLAPGRVLRSREESQSVRPQARELYLRLVSRIGLAPCGGRTFRLALSRPGQSSRWWYHPTSAKDCEGPDPAYGWLIALCAIRRAAETRGAKKLVLCGAPGELAQALRGAFEIEERNTRRPAPEWKAWLWGAASRLRGFLRALWRVYVCRWGVPEGPSDVAVCGFWDWSVRMENGEPADRYFKRLPEELLQRNISAGWLAWYDPSFEPGRAGRSDARVLVPLMGRRDIALLQAFLGIGDVARAFADLSPILLFLRRRALADFRAAFRENGCDYWPLFSWNLLKGFLGSPIPELELVALATERACRKLRPRVLMSFLEHFPHARAQYEGARRAGVPALCAAQHAGVCREKTFYLLDPGTELRGEPDGCAVPHPDIIFAMGALGRDVFLECGYAADQVLLTGSPRYDHLREPREADCRDARAARGERISLLVAASAAADVEIELLEAVAAAAEGLPGCRLILRNYPFTRLELHPRFGPHRGRFQVSGESLEEDLDRADLVLFTYSTVAEEALLRGKPAWQWLPSGFNGSALSEAADMPRFGSVAALREALREFAADQEKYRPSLELRRRVIERLFYRGDGGAAGRIADALQNILSKGRSESPARPEPAPRARGR